MNHHHGMQEAEHFGDGVDPDGDGIADELTWGDLTVITIFRVALPVPGQDTPLKTPRLGRRWTVGRGCSPRSVAPFATFPSCG